MKYIISDSSITRINETEGTIQIATEGAKIEISDSADFTDVFILSSLTPKNFSKQLYIRGYGEVENPVEVNVVNFNISEGGGGGEGLSAEDTEAIANAFKSAKVEGNTVSFYVDSDTTGTPAFYFDFPEEIFLDQVGTRLVENFSWSALAYPNSVNPNLDGKTVLTLAVKGDKEVNPTTKFSFVNLEKLIDTYAASDTSITISDYKAKVNLDASSDNILTLTSGGLLVDGSALQFDTSNLIAKDSSTTAGNIAVFDSEGGIADSTFSISEIAVTASDSSVTITNYKVKANVSAVANNSLTLKNDGLHVDISGKVDKVKNATAGNVPFLASDGTLTNSTVVGADILFKVSDATEGNVPILNSDGTLVNSTLSTSDIVTKVEGVAAGNIAVFDSEGKIANSAVAVDGVIKKVAGAKVGDIPTFDSDGGLVDSGRNFEKLNHPVRYGYKIKKTEPDPYARVEYIYDAVGFTPAKMNYDTGEFEYGSWDDVWFVKDNKPLMLKSDGTVDYYLYENDYSIKANGEDVTTPSTAADSDSDVANTEYDGNAMAQFPLVWIKRYEDDEYIYEIVSNVKYDDEYYAYAHTNADGDIKDYFYLSLFRSSGDASKVRSLSGQTVLLNTAPVLNTAVTANGPNWRLPSYCQKEVIRTLCVLISKSTSSLTAFGTQGAYSSDSVVISTTGVHSTTGQFSGIPSTNQAAAEIVYTTGPEGLLKVFHTEGFVSGGGYVAGLSAASMNAVYVKPTPEGGEYTFSNLAGMTLVQGAVLPNNAHWSSWNWIKNIKMYSWGFLVVNYGASQSTYYASQSLAGVQSSPAIYLINGPGIFHSHFYNNSTKRCCCMAYV